MKKFIYICLFIMSNQYGQTPLIDALRSFENTLKVLEIAPEFKAGKIKEDKRRKQEAEKALHDAELKRQAEQKKKADEEHARKEEERKREEAEKARHEAELKRQAEQKKKADEEQARKEKEHRKHESGNGQKPEGIIPPPPLLSPEEAYKRTRADGVKHEETPELTGRDKTSQEAVAEKKKRQNMEQREALEKELAERRKRMQPDDENGDDSKDEADFNKWNMPLN